MSDKSAHAYAIYSHRLHQRNNPQLANRIEHLAKRYERLRDTPDAGRNHARLRAVRAELYEVCFRYFYVTGSDLLGPTVDEVLVDTLQELIPRYKSENGLLVHYISNVYPLRVINAGDKQRRDSENIVSIDDPELAETRSLQAEADTYVFESLIPPDELAVDMPHNTDIDDTADGTSFVGRYCQLLVLLMEYLNHKEDIRHQAVSKLYYRMVFSERITYAVKSQEIYDNCRYIESHERETFDVMELGFIDSYMSDIVRTVHELWQTDVIAAYTGKIEQLRANITKYLEGELPRPPKMRWLDIKAYQTYLKHTYDIEVTSAVISMQRSRFDRLEGELDKLALQYQIS